MSKPTNEQRMKNVSKATKEIKRRIEIFETRRERPITREEKERIVRSVKREIRRENFIRGAFLALGITLGAGGHALLTSGEKEQSQTITEELNIGTNNEKSFKESLEVAPEKLEVSIQEDKENDERESIKKEIESLKTEDEGLAYIKEFYISEYNEKYGTNYIPEQLTLKRTREENKVGLGVAKNGDSILIYQDQDGYLPTDEGIITATIRDGNDTIRQETMMYLNKYRTIYGKNENVEEYKDNFLVELAPVLDAGISWRAAMNQEETNWKEKDNYKNNFIDSILKYNNEKEQSKDGMEIDD